MIEAQFGLPVRGVPSSHVFYRRQRRNGTVTTKWNDELEFTIYFVRFEAVVAS